MSIVAYFYVSEYTSQLLLHYRRQSKTKCNDGVSWNDIPLLIPIYANLQKSTRSIHNLENKQT